MVALLLVLLQELVVVSAQMPSVLVWSEIDRRSGLCR